MSDDEIVVGSTVRYHGRVWTVTDRNRWGDDEDSDETPCWMLNLVRRHSTLGRIMLDRVDACAVTPMTAEQEREPISHAEFSRFVTEARDMREERDGALALLDQYREGGDDLAARVSDCLVNLAEWEHDSGEDALAAWEGLNPGPLADRAREIGAAIEQASDVLVDLINHPDAPSALVVPAERAVRALNRRATGAQGSGEEA